MLVCLLSTAPEGQFLERSFEELRSIAMQSARQAIITEADLPQVHAMNSLRAIFTTTKLSARTEAFIVPTMEVAAHHLTSEV